MEPDETSWLAQEATTNRIAGQINRGGRRLDEANGGRIDLAPVDSRQLAGLDLPLDLLDGITCVFLTRE